MRKKEIVEWLERISTEMECHHKRILELEAENEKLKTNGVATAINKLNKEVFEDTKEEDLLGLNLVASKMMGWDTVKEPTLKSKVDAIIDHLKLNVSVEAKEEKVKAKKRATKRKK